MSVQWHYLDLDGLPQLDGLYLWWCDEYVILSYFEVGQQIPGGARAWSLVRSPTGQNLPSIRDIGTYQTVPVHLDREHSFFATAVSAPIETNTAEEIIEEYISFRDSIGDPIENTELKKPEKPKPAEPIRRKLEV